MSKKHTIESFIKAANLKHGEGTYLYHLVNYINNYTKVQIVCPDHGVFEQNPKNHLNGFGCRECSNKLPLNTKTFIIRAKIKHGEETYLYHLVNYINAYTKIQIVCPDHGMFEQKPNDHLNGHGCRECGGTFPLNTKTFIVRAKIKHGGETYLYHLVNYINMNTKIQIVCPDHGMFEQKPVSHLSGSGCPICNASHGEKNILYLLKSLSIDFKYQHSFSDCMGFSAPLIFDFFIERVTILLEYNGIQHYEPTSFGEGSVETKQNFIKQKEYDQRKRDYAKENGYILLEIPYTMSKEEIEILLIETINRIQQSDHSLMNNQPLPVLSLEKLHE